MEPFKRARRRGRYRRGLLAVSLMGVAAFATACGSSDDDNAGTATQAAPRGPITISVVMGFGGPYARVLEQAYQGFEAAVKQVNARGGVNGQQLKVLKVDHKETTAGGVAACKEIQSNGSLVAAVLEGNAGANTSAVKCLDNVGIPTLYVASTRDDSLRSAFTYLSTFSDEGVTVANHIKDDLGLGDTKLGVIYDNGEAYVEQQKSFDSEAQKIGLNIVKTEQVTATQSSFVPVLQQMKDAGVETVVVFATAEPPGIWRDAKSMGYRPTFTGTGYVFSFVSAAARDTAKGVTGVSKNATPESAGYAAYDKVMRGYGWAVPRVADQGFVLYGAAELLIEMLRRAGVNPTAASFVTGAETISNYDNGILPPIDFSDDHYGTSGGFPAECCNADWTWRTTGAPIG
jgi:branched-chain amino acid transport system substrate-binding protein